MDKARKLLDELMGVDRNKLSEQDSSRGVKFEDPDVCPYYLVSFCPHEIFVNTKSDIGPCEYKHHDESIRADYNVNGEKYRPKCERMFIRLLKQLISELDKKMRKAKNRLDMKPSDQILEMLNPNKDEIEESIVLMDLKIKELLQEMETYGEQGKVQEAQNINEQVEKLQSELQKLKESSNPLLKQEKEMEVCQTCGSFLVTNDVAKRLESHLEGRQHTGWAKVRAEYDRLIQKYPNLNTEYPSSSDHRSPTARRSSVNDEEDEEDRRRHSLDTYGRLNRSHPEESSREHKERTDYPSNRHDAHRERERERERDRNHDRYRISDGERRRHLYEPSSRNRRSSPNRSRSPGRRRY